MSSKFSAKIYIGVTLLALAFSLPTYAQQQQTAMPRPTTARPVKERVASWERPDRDQWQKPNEVIKALKLKNGTVVADIGAGSGYFTRKFAPAVAPKGKIYAVDIAADILEYLRQEARKQNLNNIEYIVSKEDDPMLPKNSVDLAFFADTTHHIANRVNFYRKLLPAIKKGGRMAIIDYPPEAHAKGFCPHPPEELVPRAQVIREAEEAGFKLVREFTFIPEGRQYFLLFKKRV